MGIADRYGHCSLWMKSYFVLLLVALICSWVALLSNTWAKTYAPQTTYVFGKELLLKKQTFVRIGLWRVCRYTDPLEECGLKDGIKNGLFSATQVFAVFGFVGSNLTFIAVVLAILTDICISFRDIRRLNCIVCFITAASFLTAVVVFHKRFQGNFGELQPNQYGVGFILACSVVVMEVLAGVLIMIDNTNNEVSPS